MRDSAFAYTYRQSIYDVAVREELRVADGVFRIERAVSTDLRALEYFRWPGSASEADGALAWRAPDNRIDRLDIAVVARGDQIIDTGVRRLSLEDAFGDTGASVRAASRPLAAWLWSALPWR